MGKREIARYKQFLLFPLCFQTACFQGASKGVVVWEWVNPFPNKPQFLRVCIRSVLKKKLQKKERLLLKSNFSFSLSVFLPVGKTFCHFHQMWNYHPQSLSLWKSLKFVIWERVYCLVYGLSTTISADQCIEFVCVDNLIRYFLPSANSFSLEESKICRFEGVFCLVYGFFQGFFSLPL